MEIIYVYKINIRNGQTSSELYFNATPFKLFVFLAFMRHLTCVVSKHPES